MHNKISLPGIAWSRKKNCQKGALCFQERQKAISTIEIVRPYFLTTDLGPPTLVDVGFYFDFYPDLFIKGGLI